MSGHKTTRPISTLSVYQRNTRMVDRVFCTRSLGLAGDEPQDQHADGIAAKVWQHYIEDTRRRTEEYKSWVVSLLKKHVKGSWV